ncbi:MAG: ATP-dependent Clp protease proteolytic subunit [Desulfobacterales bacterium]|nr:ATP-dependent Clp protease proteolytic subunit [Desulfobacterales bacterium]
MNDCKEQKKIKQPPVLFDKTQSIISKIESILNCKALVYWNSERGNVCQNDVLALYELFKKVGYSDEVGIYIKSNGGDVEASLRIVNLIREYFKKVTALVPLECASAATMIALGADAIKMGPLAHLSAIDSSLTHELSPIDSRENRKVSVSQDELARIVKLWNKNSKDHHPNPYSDIFKYIHPLVVGAIDRSSSLSIKICKEILSYHIKSDEECERISHYLNSEYPSHSYPITAKEANKIGLNISKLDGSLNELLLDLNEFYSEMAQKALTDFDEFNYHDNEILNILEAKNVQIYYQNDKDWNYIKEERRWQILNDESSWRKTELVNSKKIQSNFHIR